MGCMKATGIESAIYGNHHFAAGCSSCAVLKQCMSKWWGEAGAVVQLLQCFLTWSGFRCQPAVPKHCVTLYFVACCTTCGGCDENV